MSAGINRIKRKGVQLRAGEKKIADDTNRNPKDRSKAKGKPLPGYKKRKRK